MLKILKVDEIAWVKTQILHCEHTIEFLKKKLTLLNHTLEQLIMEKDSMEKE